MSPEVVRAKLVLLQQVLADLKPHIARSQELQQEAHYEIERQVQLSVDLIVALSRRILLLNNIATPESAREAIILLGKSKIISNVLANQLAKSVGMRNLLVHEYGVIDYSIFFSGLKSGYEAFTKFSKMAQKYI